MESVSPNIFVRDLEATITWYRKLGFDVATSVPDDQGKMIFALMTNGNITFMFQTLSSIDNQLLHVSRSSGGSLLLYVKMKSIRTFFDSIEDKSSVISGLEKTFYGATEFSMIDPDNFVITFAEDE
jgi:uncharacterized glyoxalase superfamily protein PhnB